MRTLLFGPPGKPYVVHWDLIACLYGMLLYAAIRIGTSRAVIAKVILLARQTVWEPSIVWYACLGAISITSVMATGIITGTTEDVTVNAIVIWKAFGAVWKGKIAPTTRHTVAELYCCSSTCTSVGLP